MNETGLIFSLICRITLGAAFAASVALASREARAAAEPPHLVIKADQPGIKISPQLYGLMTEEINYSYQGGLYGDLIQNGDFKEDKGPTASHWSLITAPGASGAMSLDETHPVNEAALTASLRLDIASAAEGRRVGVANDGYWGIPVHPDTKYQAAFYARSDEKFSGPLTVSIESADGAKTYAQAQSPRIGADWKLYTVALSTGTVTPSADARFVLSAEKAGTVWLTYVSLFPPTYHGRPNGNRIDLMEKMAGMQPSFLRLPGGNYLEGQTIAQRFDWKKTIGKVFERPGHRSPWNYHSTDGLGLLEFLYWCEDLHMQPVLAVFAGYALNGEHVTGDKLQPFIEDALDEIEYVTGDASTKWGAQRAADGHPAPFPLSYVEIGNEDNFDHSGSYEERFDRIYDAIKAKYPRLQLIATAPVKTRTPDLYDQHFYNTWDRMTRDVHHYDDYSRLGPKIFVGEWASQDVSNPWVDPQGKGPTPSIKSALGDAAWMIGLERNSDVVVMQCYAPLFVNVNPGGRQWAINLIGYDALRSFGSPSYYAQVMFAGNRGDVVLPVSFPAGAGDASEIAPRGRIGVGTWKTQAEFKDIQVTHDGQTLYQSDFTGGTGNWKFRNGDWKIQDGNLVQSTDQTNAWASSGDPQWGDYTCSCKARKISGLEGFLVQFHVRDDANYLDFNVGGWNNQQSGLEKSVNGVKSLVGGQVPGSVETGRWYDVRVELHGTDVRCFLDGKLIIAASDKETPPEPVIATASLESGSGTVILKVVNTSPKPQEFQIDLQGVQTVKAAGGQVLSGEMDDSNTLQAPDKVAPKPVTIASTGTAFDHEFPPRSITVVRFQTR